MSPNITATANTAITATITTFVVLRDRYNDTHATELRTNATVLQTAIDFAERLALDEDEDLIVGVTESTDAGAARLAASSAIEWRLWLRADGSHECTMCERTDCEGCL